MTLKLVPSKRIAEITSTSIRWVQSHAASGDIPGAYRLLGQWRFDENKVLAWIASCEQQPWHPRTSKVLKAEIRLKKRLNLPLTVKQEKARDTAYETALGVQAEKKR